MKKTAKWALGLFIIAAGVVSCYKHKRDKQEIMIAQSLENARALIDNEQSITGTWIDTTPQFDTITQKAVYVGAILTEDVQYDFIADTKTGDILFFELTETDIV